MLWRDSKEMPALILLATAELSKCRGSVRQQTRGADADLDRNRIAQRRARGKAGGDRGGGLHRRRDLRERSLVVQRHAEGRRPHGGATRPEDRDVPALP